MILPEVGLDGQKRLKAARVLVVGAGGLGSPCALYLAAAGIGKLGLVDFDPIDMSNLQRQILYSTKEVGAQKVERAAARLRELNDEIEVATHAERLTSENAMQIIEQYDVIVDGTDNFGTRYLINDACVFAGKPNVHGSIFRFEGQLSVFYPPEGPCYRCLFPSPPPPDAVPNCAEGGVLGVLAGTIGVLQATEAIKLVLKLGAPLIGRLLLYDAVDMRVDTLKITRNAECPVCGTNPTIKKLVDVAVACASESEANLEISPTTLKQMLDRNDNIFVLDVRSPEEHALCSLPNATLIPLPELEGRVQELDPEWEIVAYCKSGVRSKKATDLLRSKGFKHVKNMTGGIIKWSQDVDPAMNVY